MRVLTFDVPPQEVTKLQVSQPVTCSEYRQTYDMQIRQISYFLLPHTLHNSGICHFKILKDFLWLSKVTSSDHLILLIFILRTDITSIRQRNVMAYRENRRNNSVIKD
jgi:hypothetical protein